MTTPEAPPLPTPTPPPAAAPDVAEPAETEDHTGESGGKPRTTKPKPKPRPVDPKGAIAEAQVFMLKNQFADVVKALSPVASSSDANVHYMLGVAYGHLRDGEKSRQHYAQFLKLQPTGKQADRVRTILGS